MEKEASTWQVHDLRAGFRRLIEKNEDAVQAKVNAAIEKSERMTLAEKLAEVERFEIERYGKPLSTK